MQIVARYVSLVPVHRSDHRFALPSRSVRSVLLDPPGAHSYHLSSRSNSIAMSTRLRVATVSPYPCLYDLISDLRHPQPNQSLSTAMSHKSASSSPSRSLKKNYTPTSSHISASTPRTTSEPGHTQSANDGGATTESSSWPRVTPVSSV